MGDTYAHTTSPLVALDVRCLGGIQPSKTGSILKAKNGSAGDGSRQQARD